MLLRQSARCRAAAGVLASLVLVFEGAAHAREPQTTAVRKAPSAARSDLPDDGLGPIRCVSATTAVKLPDDGLWVVPPVSTVAPVVKPAPATTPAPVVPASLVDSAIVPATPPAALPPAARATASAPTGPFRRLRQWMHGQ